MQPDAKCRIFRGVPKGKLIKHWHLVSMLIKTGAVGSTVVQNDVVKTIAGLRQQNIRDHYSSWVKAQPPNYLSLTLRIEPDTCTDWRRDPFTVVTFQN